MKRKGYILLVIFGFAVFTVVFLSGCGLGPQGVETKNPQIKGVVEKVEYIMEGNFLSTSKTTIVKFEDGRVKAFSGISGEVFQEGKVNVITYDDLMGWILSVKIEK